MPRKAMDYSKSVVYKICCKDIDIKDCYVGSTTCLRNRKTTHKSICNNNKHKAYNCPVYKFIRDNGNWDNWEVVMLEEYPECKSGEELLKYEREHMEMLGATLNKVVIGRTMKEWCEDNKGKLQVYFQEYREDNKGKLQVYFQEYRENNKDEIRVKAREKVKCDFCGSMISKSNIKQHQRSKKCLAHQNN